jgi:hypothetical protein
MRKVQPRREIAPEPTDPVGIRHQQLGMAVAIDLGFDLRECSLVTASVAWTSSTRALIAPRSAELALDIQADTAPAATDAASSNRAASLPPPVMGNFIS